jgi:hypothetical protein
VLARYASQDIARWLYEHMKIKRTRDFKAVLAEFLKHTFDARVSHEATRFATGRAIFRGSPPGDPDNGCLYDHIRHNGKGQVRLRRLINLARAEPITGRA